MQKEIKTIGKSYNVIIEIYGDGHPNCIYSVSKIYYSTRTKKYIWETEPQTGGAIFEIDLEFLKEFYEIDIKPCMNYLSTKVSSTRQQYMVIDDKQFEKMLEDIV